MNATRRFAAWCAQRNLDEFSGVQPFHVAAFIKDLQAEVSPPTVKQHLAALRMFVGLARHRARNRRQSAPCRARPKRLSVSNDSTQVRRPHGKTHAPARRLPHDPEARESRRHRSISLIMSRPGTTKLYDRRQDEISLDEIERIAI
jgi:hypothetical protein